MATVCVAQVGHAQQQDYYPATLYHGTGLITIPVAWVSSHSADVWLQSAGKHIPWALTGNQHFASRVNTNLSIDTHWARRFSVGASYYSQNPEYGIFGQAVVLRDGDVPFLPGIAVGVRNLGNCKTEDRFFQGCDVQLQPDGRYAKVEVYKNLNTRGSVYGVATKDFHTGAMMGQLPGSASLSIGYGSGVFRDDGGMGKFYSERGTIAKGLFLGGRWVMHPSLNTTLSLLGENDGFDWNAGGVLDWRGISVGLYGTELEEGGKNPGNTVYNYTKLNASLSYNGNIIDISRGVILRTRITALTREEQRLRLEINNRERRLRVLEVALRKAQAGELATMETRRKQLEADVNAERESIRQANERLRQIEQQQRGGQTTPPSSPSPTPNPPTPPAR
jgi:hypothetical protein